MYLGLGLSIARLKGSGASDAYAINGFTAPLVLDFVNDFYRVDGATSTFSDAVTFSRASAATYTDADGVIQTATSGTPRIGNHVWNGSAWVNDGLLIESASAVQLLHTTNALVTQSYTTTAVPHTLHFTGTGTVTLSGASTAGPLVGTGTGEQNRVSLTFTPTAASLTLTVSGTVTDAQLEVGSTPSSYIPNLAASGTVTRAAETATVAAANMPWPVPVEVTGTELVTNGTFDTDISGWTDEASAGGSIAWNASGYLDLVNVTGTSRAAQDVSISAGSVYAITVQVVSLGGSSAAALYLDGAGSSAIDFVTADVGTHTIYYVAPHASLNISIRNFSIATTVSLDNISVREINPLAVSIQMDGTMTGASSALATWQADANNNILIATGASDYGFTQESASDVDTVTGGSYTAGINVPFNIASRHGSTFINGAVDGTALTADLTPTSLPALSATDFQIGPTFNGNMGKLVVWSDDIGDLGIAEASA